MGLLTNYPGAPQEVTSNGLRRLDGPTNHIPKDVASRSCRKTILFFIPFTNVQKRVYLPIREIYFPKNPICSIIFFPPNSIADTGRKAVKIWGSFAKRFLLTIWSSHKIVMGSTNLFLLTHTTATYVRQKSYCMVPPDIESWDYLNLFSCVSNIQGCQALSLFSKVVSFLIGCKCIMCHLFVYNLGTRVKFFIVSLFVNNCHEHVKWFCDNC